MRTSLNEIKYIEGYLNDQFSVDERATFETRLQKDYHFRVNVSLQKKIYSLVTFYRKRKLRREAEQVHERLFNAAEKKAFRKTILQFFNS